MRKIEHILAATDFSPRANLAVKRASVLAHQHAASLDLLYVACTLPLEIVKSILGKPPLEIEKKLLDSAAERLKTIAGLLHQDYNITVSHQVTSGRAHLEINRFAKDCGADLIVVGAYGESYFPNMVTAQLQQIVVNVI